ncbi:MAG: hypothetical protein ABSF55_01865 [Candidatus Staskawiczbacteria bacterium]|jgi:hypothetical protein
MKLKTHHKIIITTSVIAALLGFGGYGVHQYQYAQETNKIRQLIIGDFHLDSKTKTSGCEISNDLPDRACTPGAIFFNATKDQVCASGYSKSVRNVPESEKNEVYAEYSIASHSAGQYEVDHFISLELGGSNSIANLWPEAALPEPGFHQKDEVENYLHDKLCNGQISLQEAQYLVSNKWLEVYKLIH